MKMLRILAWSCLFTGIVYSCQLAFMLNRIDLAAIVSFLGLMGFYIINAIDVLAEVIKNRS